MPNHNDVANLIFEFDKIASGVEYPAWVLGGALHTFDLFRSDEVLTEVQRDSLLSVVLRAQVRLDLDLPPDFDRDALREGMQALCVRIIDRADSAEVRSSRDPSLLADARDHVRILRNVAHNFDLKQCIRERQKPGATSTGGRRNIVACAA